jgi:excisionase family DNA binding protein
MARFSAPNVDGHVDGFVGRRIPAQPSPVGPHERLLTVPQVALRLSISAATVYSLVSMGALLHLRVSNAIRVRPADLEAYCQTVTARNSAGHQFVGRDQKPLP